MDSARQGDPIAGVAQPRRGARRAGRSVDEGGDGLPENMERHAIVGRAADDLVQVFSSSRPGVVPLAKASSIGLPGLSTNQPDPDRVCCDLTVVAPADERRSGACQSEMLVFWRSPVLRARHGGTQAEHAEKTHVACAERASCVSVIATTWQPREALGARPGCDRSRGCSVSPLILTAIPAGEEHSRWKSMTMM